MYSVESLLQSRHSVGSESETEKEQAQDTGEEKEKEGEQTSQRIRSKACFKAAILHIRRRRIIPTKRRKRRGSREVA
jgi:hypothetical protein